ncbi:MAG: hypothetical protein CFE43_17645 [Burkholderiales bacterium PBB3]|nr:MAG: hypothetical protein CFE43_17645 [Burkholderiales bacterium PBB3]
MKEEQAMSAHHTHLHRRGLLQALTGAAAVWASPALWAAASPAGEPAGRLVVVFLRGAYDGLSAFVPHGDANYYRIRPNIAIAPPDGTNQTTLALDGTFGLHPALEPLMPFWQQGVLGVIPAAGSPDPTRSHFDAQHHWEIGIPGKSSAANGWLNGLAGLQAHGAVPSAVGVGEANPTILSGPAPVQRVPRGDAATKEGSLADARTRKAVMSLYSGQDALSRSFQSGAQSRMQTAKTLNEGMADMAMESAQMLAASNGAGSAKGLLLDAQHLGTLMRKDPKLRIGFLSAGGWDTHANQGNQTGALANNLGNLAQALVQLRKDFSGPNDMIVMMSEFGRTSAENGTRGTDHGHGNALWLLGNRVQGGRWHGTWNGLAADSLHEGRDLPVHHDFRGVLAQVLRSTQGLTAAQVDTLFPGYAWDAGLNGLMRA